MYFDYVINHTVGLGTFSAYYLYYYDKTKKFFCWIKNANGKNLWSNL